MTIPEMADIFRGHDSGNDVGYGDSEHSSFTSLLLLVENSTLPLHHGHHPHHHPHNASSAALGPGGGGGGGVEGEEGVGRRWGVLGLLVIIVCSIVGNVLVCLAVCWERRLQNMTNYFLMSLAMADLLVSVVVMPLGMIVELFGHFPLGAEVCVIWVSSDVLMCTASIWHMCTMSMDRYFTLKYPMRYGRNKTKTMVVIKIFFVWIVSVAISSPICIHGFIDPTIVYNQRACVPVLKDFVIYGSVFAFYIPLLIMIVTYVLTIRILWSNQQIMQNMNQTDLRPGLAQMTAQCTGFAMPQMPRLITPVPRPDTNSDTDIFASAAPHANGGVGHVVQAAGQLPTNILLLSPAGPSPSASFPGLSLSCSQQLPEVRPVGRAGSLERLRGGDRRRSRRLRSQGEVVRREDSDSEEEEEDLPSTRLLQEHSLSYKSLCTRTAISNSTEDFFTRASSTSPSTAFSRLTPSEKSASFRERRPKSTHLDVPGQVLYRRGGRLGPALYITASDTQIPSSSSCCTPDGFKTSFHQSFSGLETDYKSMEWDRRFFEIQKEMDDCLQDGGGDSENSAAGAQKLGEDVSPEASAKAVATLELSERVPNGGEKLRGQRLDAVKTALTRTPHRPTVPSNLAFTRQGQRNPRSKSKRWSHSAPNTPNPCPRPAHTSDSDNDRDTSGSSTSDVITIRLYPPTSPTLESAQHSASEDLTENSLLRSVVVSSEADNTQDDSDAIYTNDESPATESRERGFKQSRKHKRLLKARFRNTLRASRRPMFKHLLSTKTASNERKASKVLGIIFLVFVTLWTPFFIVNILSVTCEGCMEGVTKDVMSVFIWMGYVASLANPIIYTMFNTAFRRTFINILTCRLTRTRRMKFSDFTTYPSMTTTMMPSERRGTMTVLLDHRT